MFFKTTNKINFLFQRKKNRYRARKKKLTKARPDIQKENTKPCG